MSRSISIIIPAFNEEHDLPAAVDSAIVLFGELVKDYEVLIFNDGSRDGTGAIADSFANRYPNVKAVHYPQNRGLSMIARDAIAMATKDHLMWYSAYNSIDPGSLRELVSAMGQADIILAYMANPHDRPWGRRILSRLFTGVVNVLFGLRVHYYNGPTIYPLKILKAMTLCSRGHTVFAEMSIRTLKISKTFLQLPFVHNTNNRHKSKSITIKNVYNIARTLIFVWIDVFIRRNPLGSAGTRAV